MSTPTIADLIGRYVQIRDHVAALDKEHVKRLTPYQDALAAIEAAVTEEINRLGGESIKTEQGTAYRSTTLAAKVVDREMFMDFVFDGRREGFLTSHVAKDAVKEYMDGNNGELPAGVEVTFVHKTNFRRA